jgi:hypothetical protein
MNDPGRSDLWSSRRVWSLWEIMQRLDAVSLLNIIKTVETFREDFRHRKASDGRPPENHQADITLFEEMSVKLKALGFAMSHMQANRIAGWLKTVQQAEYGFYKDLLTDLSRRLDDELSQKNFMELSDRQREMYGPSSPLFGDQVAEKFPTEMAFEIDEAGKCIALGRHTAAIFNQMRVLEIGIRAIARCLDIPDPSKPAQRNWGVILKAIRDGINQNWPSAADKMTSDAVLFDSLYASLDSVRNPWRNAAMHVETKYTEDEAEHIYVAVRGFTRKLASRCDEKGEPKA